MTITTVKLFNAALLTNVAATYYQVPGLKKAIIRKLGFVNVIDAYASKEEGAPAEVEA